MESGGRTTRLECPGGHLLIHELAGGRRRLETVPDSTSATVFDRTWDTAYPVDLIATILDVKKLRAVCDEIRREEDPDYLQKVLWWTLRSHIDPGELGPCRILDFGCGSGASTMILARMFPTASIVGVDIDADARRIAEQRRRYYGLDRVEFRSSDSATSIPSDVGQFDLVMCSGLLEHLLPDERKSIIPDLWSHLRTGGLLFVCETPHRFTPIEVHTTGGLPLVNYLPPRLALAMAKLFSNRIEPTATWEQLLRRGMRGGTEREFMRYLQRSGHRDARIERPVELGVRDEFDLWYAISARRPSRSKAALRSAFRALRRTTGVSFTPYLTFAVRKDPRSQRGCQTLKRNSMTSPSLTT